MNEQEVVAMAKNGDQAAFEQLVTAYEKKVYHLAYSYTGNEQDSLDICQDVFLRVFRFLPQFNQESRFSTWLYRIAVNACKDNLRKRQSRMEVSLCVDEEEGFSAEPADLRYNPEDLAERAELQRALSQGLQELSEPHREILLMRDIAGLSYSEIGRCLSLEQGTVKSRIARARENLRAFLTKEGNIPVLNVSKSTEGGAVD